MADGWFVRLPTIAEAVMTIRLLSGVVLLLLSACVHTPPDTDLITADLLEPPRRGRPSDQILPSELRLVSGRTAADAVRQLRPEFLRVAPTRTINGQPVLPSVYLDGRPAGGLDALGTIPLLPVVEIRYVTAVAAKSVFGSYCDCAGGVIVVRTRAGTL